MGERKLKTDSYLKLSVFRRQIQDSVRNRKLFKRFLFWWKNGTRFNRMIWNDVVTGKEWEIDFVFVAFPGLKTMGYRVEGYHRLEKPSKSNDYIGDGEMEEFGTLIISDGDLKVVQW